ncbi:Fe-S cluster assembly protein HesB [Thalassobaculum sp.]|uniref:endonuclease III domain-containing protein n=1 Tax=Thalassobaculum sp. TaxID=2022740 RepID=UPI0032ED2A1E
MQHSFNFGGRDQVLEAHERLLAAYGLPPATLRLDPLSQLVLAMLGGRTVEAIGLRAFEALANRVSRWEEVLQLSQTEIESLIRNVTYASRKAMHVSQALAAIIRRRGRLDLNFLGQWSVDKALAWLQALPGVGPKSSAAVLNFSTLHQRALVVDTHHWRAAQRLRLIPWRTPMATAANALMRHCPDVWTADDMETHHLLFKHLGQDCCRHGWPRCRACPLREMCPGSGWFQPRQIDCFYKNKS